MAASTPIVITMGDPAGIGPEVVVTAMNELVNARVSVVIAAAPEVMTEAVRRYGSGRLKTLLLRAPWLKPGHDLSGICQAPITLLAASRLSIKKIKPGRSGIAEGRAAWECLEAAMTLIRSGAAAGLVTAPVTKSSLLAAGFPYPGHTDWLAAQAGGRAVMMLAAGSFRVVPVTVHIPIKNVARTLTQKILLETIRTTAAELSIRFRIKAPRLAVSGLNPHAGERGELGREEQTVIEPAIQKARSSGLTVSGPFPADAMFTAAARRTYDAAICMYHDQALIPLKTIGRDRAVNLTLGLSFIRTSPAHGTAPEIAWTGQANPGSMIEAIKTAVRLAR